MKCIVRNSFYKNLPKHNVKSILHELNKFVSEFVSFYKTTGRMPHSHSVRKIKGNNEIYKFRVNSASRILFTFSSKIDSFDEKSVLVIIDYCDHDNQINRANNVKIKTGIYTNLKNDTSEDLLEEIIDINYKNFIYNPENDISREIYNFEDFVNSLEEDENNAIYYLNQEQRICVNESNLPLLILGSAGSGKTTVGLNKIYLLYTQNKLNIGYFTYSEMLKKETESMFNYLCEKKGATKYESDIEFNAVNDFLLQKIDKCKFIKYKNFDDWFKYKYKFRNLNLDSLDVWRDIRGIIKGMIGIDWIPGRTKQDSDYKKSIIAKIKMDRVDYIKLPSEYSFFSESERQIVYDVCIDYQEWLNVNNFVDENDMARIMLGKINCTYLNQFDFILIDEVQDLTEVQIYLLTQMVKFQTNIIMSGDYNQTVTPTYFNSTRIESLLRYKYGIKTFYKKKLVYNYRNCKSIIDLSNEVIKLRINNIASDKRNDYFEKTKFTQYKDKPFFLENINQNKEKLFEASRNRHYVAIIVSNEAEKKKLEKKLNCPDNIYTISEIKGVEKKYIICYNLISSNKEIWNEILDKNNKEKHNNYKYRYHFNMLYVAITRARENICFIEDEHCKLYNKFNGLLTYIENFDEKLLNMAHISTASEFYKEGLYLEKKGLYQKAIHQYKKVDTYESKKSIKRCKAFLLKNNRKFHNAANLFFEVEDYKNSLECFKKINNVAGIFKCTVMLKESYKQISNELTELANPAMLFFSIKTTDKIKLPWEKRFMRFFEEYIDSKTSIYKDNSIFINETIIDMKK